MLDSTDREERGRMVQTNDRYERGGAQEFACESLLYGLMQGFGVTPAQAIVDL